MNMKMKSCFLLLLYFGLTCCRGVYADNVHDVKRGAFPYMAFIYYSDPSVVDASGQRFVRSAVLIRADWLVTSALGPSIIDPSYDFPNKTLLARAGAIAIDDKFTLNEDENEQERERNYWTYETLGPMMSQGDEPNAVPLRILSGTVAAMGSRSAYHQIVQIVRPYNHSATQWWTTDISLIKTLLPFNITSAVDVKNLYIKSDADYKSCSILVYTKKIGNLTEGKSLVMLFVELLPPSIDNCGSHFKGSTMACAIDSDGNKHAYNDKDFCHGNSGGPLICEKDVIGLQTYIGDNCKQPHLYQLLHGWDNFITCAIEDKCQEDHCSHICKVNFKDPPSPGSVTLPEEHDNNLARHSDYGIVPKSSSPLEPPASTVFVGTAPIANMVANELVNLIERHINRTAQAISAMPESPTSTFVTMETSTDPTHTMWPKDKETDEFWHKDKSTEKPWTKEKETPRPNEKETTTWTRETETTLTQDTEPTWIKEETPTPKNKVWPKDKEETKLPWLGEQDVKAWPKKKVSNESNKKDDDEENLERPTQVEAQQHEKDKKRTSATDRNMCVIQTVLFGFIVLLCL